MSLVGDVGDLGDLDSGDLDKDSEGDSGEATGEEGSSLQCRPRNSPPAASCPQEAAFA